MNLGRRARRKKAKLEAKGHKGPCFFQLEEAEGLTHRCGARGRTTLHCRTCEQLRDAGKLAAEDVFTLQTCSRHYEQAETLMKSHALGAHPVNIMRAAWAALKGDL